MDPFCPSLTTYVQSFDLTTLRLLTDCCCVYDDFKVKLLLRNIFILSSYQYSPSRISYFRIADLILFPRRLSRAIASVTLMLILLFNDGSTCKPPGVSDHVSSGKL